MAMGAQHKIPLFRRIFRPKGNVYTLDLQTSGSPTDYLIRRRLTHPDLLHVERSPLGRV